MNTWHQIEKEYLGNPKSPLSGKNLEAFHSGANYKNIAPWTRHQLPTTSQLLLKLAYSICIFGIKVLLFNFFHCDQFKNTLKTDLPQSIRVEVERLWLLAEIKTMSRQGMDKKE